ncbi:MAG TPA: hypothetical protein VEL79_02690, partial [Vicinamibacterales bacterium]|nr:hypothetical protein [Vicinamibacterales bacterium]
GIRKLTRDHSPVGEREDAGELSENDAMRHPHRNEVFRDVGTIFRDKDEQDFVEIVEEPLEADAAILLCSDGLSDMLPASTIAHIVRQHAGNPEQVVEALVAAANDAGGRDNITVVYAEMPLFADKLTGGASQRRTPTEPIDGSFQPPPEDAAPSAMPVRTGRFRRAARAIIASRTVWFTAGALAGVIGALALTAYVASRQVHGSQTLIVAPDGTSPLTTIGAALAAARPGDVVRVEPGVYRERVEVRDGIDLIARVPGTVTIIQPGNVAAPILTITGALNVRVAGIRIETGTPTDIGVRIAAPAATLEMMDIAGPIRHALALSPASSVTVRGSRITVTGTLLAVPEDGHATFVSSILTRTGASNDGALSLSPSAQVVLRGNVFAGFGTAIIDGVAPSQRAELLAGNIVVPGDDRSGVSAPAGAGENGARTPAGRGTKRPAIPGKGR